MCVQLPTLSLPFCISYSVYPDVFPFVFTPLFPSCLFPFSPVCPSTTVTLSLSLCLLLFLSISPPLSLLSYSPGYLFYSPLPLYLPTTYYPLISISLLSQCLSSLSFQTLFLTLCVFLSASSFISPSVLPVPSSPSMSSLLIFASCLYSSLSLVFSLSSLVSSPLSLSLWLLPSVSPFISLSSVSSFLSLLAVFSPWSLICLCMYYMQLWGPSKPSPTRP